MNLSIKITHSYDLWYLSENDTIIFIGKALFYLGLEAIGVNRPHNGSLNKKCPFASLSDYEPHRSRQILKTEKKEYIIQIFLETHNSSQGQISKADTKINSAFAGQHEHYKLFIEFYLVVDLWV